MPTLIISSRTPLLPLSLITSLANSSGFRVVPILAGLDVIGIIANTQLEIDQFLGQFEPSDINTIRDVFPPNPRIPRFTPNYSLSTITNEPETETPRDAFNPSTPVYTATQLAKIYKFPHPKHHVHNKIAIISFSGGLLTNQQGQFTDVLAYWTALGIEPENFPHVTVIPLLGASASYQDDPFNGNPENALDVEIAGACCPSSTTQIALYCTPNTALGFFTAYITAISNPGFKPDVIACSWGASEHPNHTGFMNIMNAVFEVAQTNGISLSCASGDGGFTDGVGDESPHVDFPGSSPWVTTCGGTTLICPNLKYDHHTTETAWSGTGGGLSIIFPQPRYQCRLKEFFNQRAVPDVTLVGDPRTPVSIVLGAQTVLVGGTSLGAQLMSAYFALIKPCHFINPELYKVAKQHHSTFHDIIVGGNGLYQAKKGFDLVSGLGSMDGEELKSHL